MLFENTFTFTKELYKTCVITRFRDARQGTCLICFFACAALLVGGVWTLVTGRMFLGIFLPVAAVYFLLLGLGAFIPLTSKEYKSSVDSWSDSQYVLRFYGDHLERLAGDKKSQLPYSRLTKLLENKEAFVLVADNAFFFPVKKGSFTQGDQEEFRAFLSQKVKEAEDSRKAGEEAAKGQAEAAEPDADGNGGKKSQGD